MPANIKVLLIENQPLTRIGVKAVLAATDDIRLVDETDNSKDGFRLFAELSPDVTILGLHFLIPARSTISTITLSSGLRQRSSYSPNTPATPRSAGHSKKVLSAIFVKTLSRKNC